MDVAKVFRLSGQQATLKAAAKLMILALHKCDHIILEGAAQVMR